MSQPPCVHGYWVGSCDVCDGATDESRLDKVREQVSRAILYINARNAGDERSAAMENVRQILIKALEVSK